jgi:hypothetical protein
MHLLQLQGLAPVPPRLLKKHFSLVKGRIIVHNIWMQERPVLKAVPGYCSAVVLSYC